MSSKTFGRIFLKTLGVLSFCAVTSYVLFLAYGYNLDLQHNNIEKRSLVDISSKVSEVRVYFDDRLIGNALPLQVKDLVPGSYHLDISKLGYLPWNRDLIVQTDLVTKVEDVVLVPEHPETLVQQLARFPEKSRYFTGKDFFIVLAPNSDYLTLVYLLPGGAMKEEELKLSRRDIQDIHIYNSKRFLVSFENRGYQWVEFDGPRFIDFELPQGARDLDFVSSNNMAYFIYDKALYAVPHDRLSGITVAKLKDFIISKNVDRFDVQENRLVYLSAGVVYAADSNGGNARIIDRSQNIAYVRFESVNSGRAGFFVVRTKDNRRLLYASDDRGQVTLLTSKLYGEIFIEGDRLLFADDSGAVFVYKSHTKMKTPVTTLPKDFVLQGLLFGDGHFVYSQNDKLYLADSSFSNVYELGSAQKDQAYFLQNGGIYFLSENKLKSLYLLPKS